MPGRLEAIAEVCEDEDTTAPLFYFAEYEYGDLVVKEGKFVPPCGTHTSCAECRELSRYASYSHIPLAFVQRNAVEVFAGETRASRQGKTVPLRVLAAGEMFGVFETLDYLLGSKLDPPSYSVSAGARSVWVLAPLGDVRLTKLIGEETGTDLEWDRNESHWSLIQAATRNSAKWKTSVVVFSESFVRLLKESESAASAFRQLLLETGWQQSAALRHTAGKNAFLRAWYLDGPARTLPMPLGELYQFATICHLLSIAEGDYPAYQSIGAGEHVLGPFEIFEKILGNALCALRAKVPQASTYYPVVLQPAHLNVNCPAGYYSFRCPSLLGSVDHNVTNYSDTIAPIAKTLHSLCESKSGISIDLEKTLFFAQAG
ncbi:MAG TPA: hypothetical protein VMD25_00775 [Acidobacteriaceae bacterium]|nr:hypothetical protein [Acidobacteriaceae bacterium]